MRSTPAKQEKARNQVLRFRASERRLHWSIALPFLVCYVTALILVVVYNPDPLRPYRDIVSWTHRISGLFLLVMPVYAVIRSVGDFKVHFYNIKQAWVWVLSDVKWLMLMGLAAISKRVPLPEQGKFNAAQKLNFMMVMSTYPFYVVTGLAMWISGAALLAWLIHFSLALIATPFVLGHIFMATIPRETRKGLQGMFSGLVDRHWAKHHHARWYREQFQSGKTDRRAQKAGPPTPSPIHSPSPIPERHAALAAALRDESWPAAAQHFRALWPEVRDLRIGRQQMHAIIRALLRENDLTTVAKASALIILGDPHDTVAVNALMKAAEFALRGDSTLRDAVNIYNFLLKHCFDSPYAAYFQRGLEEAHARLDGEGAPDQRRWPAGPSAPIRR